MNMMTELCQNLRNWFDRNQKKWRGKFRIDNGAITFVSESHSEDFFLARNQYFRIIGSLFNDGVHIYDNDELINEEFDGVIWAMAVPPAVVALCEEIEAWQNQYGGVGSITMSPYSSESFGGYSYTKASGNSTSGSATITWKDMFASRLNAWRKI